MNDDKPKRRPVKAVLDGFDRVTAARLLLMVGVLVLIVVHGVDPTGFDIDGTSLALIGVAVVLVLVPLLKSAKLPGGASLEFRELLDELKTETELAEDEQQRITLAHAPSAPVVEDSEVPASTAPGPARMGAPGGSSVSSESDVERARAVTALVLTEAVRSPRVGLIMLTGALEREVRDLLMTTGWATEESGRSLRAGVARLVEVGVLTASAASALNLFSKARNEIVHGHETVSDTEILRAIDAGISLLQTVAAIPRERNTVLHPGVDVYAGASATTPIPGVRGLLLRTENPTRTTTSVRIYPTTKDDYEVGRQVAWEWGPSQWGPAWYRDPDSGEVKEAWLGSMEFIGRQLGA